LNPQREADILALDFVIINTDFSFVREEKAWPDVASGRVVVA
jgi:hypothetical protein